MVCSDNRSQERTTKFLWWWWLWWWIDTPFVDLLQQFCHHFLNPRASSGLLSEIDVSESYNCKLEKKIIQERKCLAGVYANHNLRLARIHVYGFDYDYTLAHYTNHLQFLIYNLVKAQLVTEVRLSTWAVVENDWLSDKFMQSLLAKKNLLIYTKTCYNGIEFFMEIKSIHLLKWPTIKGWELKQQCMGHL